MTHARRGDEKEQEGSRLRAYAFCSAHGGGGVVMALVNLDEERAFSVSVTVNSKGGGSQEEEGGSGRESGRACGFCGRDGSREEWQWDRERVVVSVTNRCLERLYADDSIFFKVTSNTNVESGGISGPLPRLP